MQGTAFTIDRAGRQYLVTARHVIESVSVGSLSIWHEEQWKALAVNVVGVGTAQNNLGLMYSNGEGVPQDNVEAHMWLNLAASRLSGADRERTVATRDRVAERMTPADLSEAQRRAREWHAAHQLP